MTTIESAITTLKISTKAIVLIAQMKAILTTPELITEYVHRVMTHPSANDHCRNGYAFQVLCDMRKEQLTLNPMSDDLFLDMHLLNPVKALTLYFKENIVPLQVERMKKWGINAKDLITAKQHDSNIRFERAVMQLV
ncbi:hypothetical protein [Paenibacillus sp. QZ-Y1]|uniref:hypothetical protein n=1 Tax=Paenibacillus sp. QZ-Y1 TaxID=3414511 RepID=UPI003F7933B0